MSVTDTLSGLLGKAGDNPTLIAATSQIASMFENVPAIGSLGKAAGLLATTDALVRSATGGKHNVLGVAAAAVQSAGPKFAQVIETCMGAACKAPGKESGIQAAVDGLKGHFAAGAEAIQNGAKTAMAHVSGKSNTRA